MQQGRRLYFRKASFVVGGEGDTAKVVEKGCNRGQLAPTSSTTRSLGFLQALPGARDPKLPSSCPHSRPNFDEARPTLAIVLLRAPSLSSMWPAFVEVGPSLAGPREYPAPSV